MIISGPVGEEVGQERGADEVPSALLYRSLSIMRMLVLAELPKALL